MGRTDAQREVQKRRDAVAALAARARLPGHTAATSAALAQAAYLKALAAAAAAEDDE